MKFKTTSVNRFIMLCFCILAECQCTTKREETTGQVLRINNQGQPASLHPHLGIDLQCRIYQKALFEGLTRIGPQGTPEFAGCKNVEVSPSKTIYTFTLRPMKWTNGAKVTSYQFANSWKKAISPNSNCIRADLFYIIRNSEKVKKGELSLDLVGIYAPDEDTLVVELEHPAPYFLDLIANPLFSPLFDDSEAPKIFNGPFYVASQKPDREIILEKNKLYWDADSVKLDKIVISQVPDPNTALLMYEKKELDWIGHPFTNLPQEAVLKMEKAPGFQSHPILAVYWICLNTQSFPLNSPKMRKALSYALNRQEIVNHVLFGETPTKSLTLSLLKEEELYADGDLKEARRLFKEALTELHLTEEDFPKLKISHSDIPGQKKLAEMLQQQWQEVFNIETELVGTEWNTFFANLGSRQFQIGGCVGYSVYQDPIYFLEFFKKRGHAYNSPQWEHPDFQKLLAMAELETDLTLRAQHLRQAEKVLLDEMPVIPLFIFHSKYLKSPDVKGLFVNNLGQTDFKWASIEKSI